MRDIYSGVNDKWSKNHGRNLMSWKKLIRSIAVQKFYDVNLNKYGTWLRFLEDNGWISSIDPYGWFEWYFRYWLGRRSLDVERQIGRWKGLVSRFRGQLIKMIGGFNGRFDDFSISPKIRQILLHWGYELVESDLLWLIFLFK